ncbi:MAG: penicillin-binding protein 2 [Candidatus Nanopelagicales bacterium]
MSEKSSVRLVVLGVLIVSLVGTLLARLFYLQLVAGDQYRAQAASNSTREVITPAVRGIILDQRGRPLVANRTSLVVSIDRSILSREEDDGDAVIGRLAEALGVSKESLQQKLMPCGSDGAPPPPVCWDGSPYQPVPVAKDVATDTALKIMERRADFPGVTAQLEAVREYPAPFEANLAHVLGYVGPVTQEQLDAQGDSTDPARLRSRDLVGRNGLEAQYDAELRGIPGITTLAVDQAGRVTGTVAESDPVAGNYVVTSIDAHLQQVVEQALSDAVDRSRAAGEIADSGAALVVDVTNGDILAMASYPTYDPKIWVGGITTDDYERLLETKALSSNVVQGTYPPGSTYKAVTTVAAAREGYDLNGTYDCPGDYTVGSQRFRNFESSAYGPISLSRALEVSCNTVFYRIADELWLKSGGLYAPDGAPDPIAETADAFLLGHRTGIDLPNEAMGLVSGRDEKLAVWEQRREQWCADAKAAFPDVRQENARLADYYTALAKENCLDGFRWRNGDAINASIGQGDTSITPLQLAMTYAAIANGGTVFEPHVAKAILTSGGEVVQQFGPVVRGTVDAPVGTFDFLRTALAGVTTDGTGRIPFEGFPLDTIPIASKTGSAQVFGAKSTTAWYASFAPANDPKYAVIMMVTQGGTGSLTVGPSIRTIYEALFGVQGDVVDPTTSVLVGGSPSTSLPIVRPDGIPVTPADEASPSPSTTGAGP